MNFILIKMYSGKNLFLPVRFLRWKKQFFPPSDKNLPTLSCNRFNHLAGLDLLRDTGMTRDIVELT